MNSADLKAHSVSTVPWNHYRLSQDYRVFPFPLFLAQFILSSLSKDLLSLKKTLSKKSLSAYTFDVLNKEHKEFIYLYLMVAKETAEL